MYKKLPYNPRLKKYARDLRSNSTISEIILWQHIKNKQFHGLDFDRQKIIGDYIVDFYCSSLNLVIEIDGMSHIDKRDDDLLRDKFLIDLGLYVLRLDDEMVRSNLDKALEKMNNAVKVILSRNK